MKNWRSLLVREVSEAGLIPRGFAVAYWCPWSMVGVCYPIGLHLLVSITRRTFQVLYYGLIHARVPEAWETLYRVRYDIGRQRGYEAGFEAGVRFAESVRHERKS